MITLTAVSAGTKIGLRTDLATKHRGDGRCGTADAAELPEHNWVQFWTSGPHSVHGSGSTTYFRVQKYKIIKGRCTRSKISYATLDLNT